MVPHSTPSRATSRSLFDTRSMMPAAPSAMTPDSRCRAPWSMNAAVTAAIMAMLLANRPRSLMASCSDRAITSRMATSSTKSLRP